MLKRVYLIKVQRTCCSFGTTFPLCRLHSLKGRKIIFKSPFYMEDLSLSSLKKSACYVMICGEINQKEMPTCLMG